MLKRILLLLLLAGCAFGQGLPYPGFILTGGAPPPVTPGFVNNVQTSNIRTDTLGTKNWNGTVCADRQYCTHYADGTLSGNLGLIWAVYDNTNAVTMTTTDDKGGGSSTYTQAVAVQNASNYKLQLWTTPNLASGIFNVYVTSSGAASKMATGTQQWYNLDTSSPVRATSSNAGASSTTIDAGSLSASNGDLVIMVACRSPVPSAATSFTKGSQANITWAKVPGSSDIIQGCFAQWGIYTGSGAFNPQATQSGASAYLAAAVALKPVSAGNAPSGMYISGIEHQEIVAGTGTTTNHEFPCTGNLLVLKAGGAPTRWITAISSTPSLTWTAAHTQANDGNNTVSTWYAPNASCSTDLTASITWNSSTGDNTILGYDIHGAATSPFRFGDTQLSSMTLGAGQSIFTRDIDGLGNQVLGPQPGITNGILLGTDIHNLNTGSGMTSPSGARFDAVLYGGQSLDGPSTDDQNNDWGHSYTTSSAIANWTWSFADSVTDPGAFAGSLTSFLSSTGNIVPRALKGQVATSSNSTTTQTLSYAPIARNPSTAPHSLVVSCSINNTAAGVTAISLTTSSGDTVTAVGSMTTVTSLGKFANFIVKAYTDTTQTLTCTFTGTTGTHRKNIAVAELDGVNQTTPVDVSTVTNALEDGSGVFCSGNVTNTATNQVALGMMYCPGVCQGLSSVGSGYLLGAQEDTQGKGFWEWKIVNSTSTFNACSTDIGSGGSVNAGAALVVLNGGN